MLLLLCVGGCGQEREARLTASCVHGGVQVCRCANFMLLVVMLRMFPHVHKSKKWCRVTCQHIRGAYGAHFLSFLEWSDFANPPAKSQGTTLKQQQAAASSNKAPDPVVDVKGTSATGGAEEGIQLSSEVLSSPDEELP